MKKVGSPPEGEGYSEAKEEDGFGKVRCVSCGKLVGVQSGFERAWQHDG